MILYRTAQGGPQTLPDLFPVQKRAWSAAVVEGIHRIGLVTGSVQPITSLCPAVGTVSWYYEVVTVSLDALVRGLVTNVWVGIRNARVPVAHGIDRPDLNSLAWQVRGSAAVLAELCLVPHAFSLDNPAAAEPSESFIWWVLHCQSVGERTE